MHLLCCETTKTFMDAKTSMDGCWYLLRMHIINTSNSMYVFSIYHQGGCREDVGL